MRFSGEKCSRNHRERGSGSGRGERGKEGAAEGVAEEIEQKKQDDHGSFAAGDKGGARRGEASRRARGSRSGKRQLLACLQLGVGRPRAESTRNEPAQQPWILLPTVPLLLRAPEPVIFHHVCMVGRRKSR